MDLTDVQPSSLTQKKLRDLVTINTVLSGVCFVGIILAVLEDQRSLKKETKCNPTKTDMENLVMYGIFSFVFPLFSTLLALTLKTNTLNTPVSMRWYRFTAMICLSAFVVGVVFVMLTFMEIAVIELGNFSCGNASKMVSGVVFAFGSLGAIIFGYRFVCYFSVANLV
ncbi:uncharacterized protein LOC131617799 [Vicia villosa]|uniref:uncharacterized protein LOC131617799 n=1 Tax=Vicia villosa TaxID=3911 RepID=UPI00273A84EF|nr:uncharacterized protein LOC131617799 [Vicia villosa]